MFRSKDEGAFSVVNKRQVIAESDIIELKETLDSLLRFLTQDEYVCVEIAQTGSTILFEVFVPVSKIGLVIGREGATAKALSRILSSVCGAFKMKAVFNIIEMDAGGGYGKNS